MFLGDLCGRTLAGLIKLPGRSKFGRLTVVVLSVLRIAFVPAFLLCNVLPGERTPESIVFPLDSEFIVIMALFAVSNGYICSVCMIHGPAVPGATSGVIAKAFMLCLLLFPSLIQAYHEFFAVRTSQRFLKFKNINECDGGVIDFNQKSKRKITIDHA